WKSVSKPLSRDTSTPSVCALFHLYEKPCHAFLPSTRLFTSNRVSWWMRDPVSPATVSIKNVFTNTVLSGKSNRSVVSLHGMERPGRRMTHLFLAEPSDHSGVLTSKAFRAVSGV